MLAAVAVLLLTQAEVQALKEKKPAPLFDEIRKQARRAMTQGPWSVTFARPSVPGPAPNEFYSMGPYWWPDPGNPTGKWIRRDGERNPDRFTRNDDDMGAMSNAVLSLGLAAALLDDRAAAERAAEVIRVWFVDPKTRMAPQLEWGQAIPGVADKGRGTGLIDSVPLIYAVQGMALLERSGHWNGDAAREWFREYLRWMTASKKGRDEKNAPNNHGTWWAAQVAAYAAFVDDRETLDGVWSRYRDVLIPNQLRPDGSAPLEEARTRSLSYSAMNLGGFSIICRIAQTHGVDLWRFRTADGAGLERSIKYLKPYVENPDSWKKQQITPFGRDRVFFLAFGGLALKRPEWIELYRAKTKGVAPFDLVAAAALEAAK